MADMRWIWDVCGRGSWTSPEEADVCREWVDMLRRAIRRIGRRGLGSKVVRQGRAKIIERGHEAVAAELCY